jgi:hypothetical protein
MGKIEIDIYDECSKHFIVRYYPKDRAVFNGKSRKIIKAAMLPHYLPADYANTAILSALKSRTCLYTCKHRTYGKLKFYPK